jgi:hypothetical protein
MGEKISEDAIVIFVMLLVYIGFGAILEHYHVSFGHEAAITIIIGKFHKQLYNSKFVIKVCSFHGFCT